MKSGVCITLLSCWNCFVILLLLLSAEVQQSGYCLKMPKPLFSDLIIEKWLVVNHSFPQNQYLKLCN